MLPLRRTPVWTLARRRRFLAAFRRDLERYFASVTYEAFPFRVVESAEAASLRSSLEARSGRCNAIFAAAGSVSPVRHASGASPGEVIRVNVVEAAFQLDRFDLTREELLRLFDAAQDAHAREVPAAWLRMANPLYWLEMGLSVAEVLPFLPLRWVGGDPAGAAGTAVGVSLRTGVRLAVLALLAWTLLAALGLGDEARALLGTLIGRIRDVMPV